LAVGFEVKVGKLSKNLNGVFDFLFELFWKISNIFSQIFAQKSGGKYWMGSNKIPNFTGSLGVPVESQLHHKI
jgi:hypothetical protein